MLPPLGLGGARVVGSGWCFGFNVWGVGLDDGVGRFLLVWGSQLGFLAVFAGMVTMYAINGTMREIDARWRLGRLRPGGGIGAQNSWGVSDSWRLADRESMPTWCAAS